jgi:hypothetical protein
MTQEYGNYEKYDKNRVKLEYKEEEEQWGTDKIYANYLEMLKRLPTRERDEANKVKRNEIHDLLTTQEHAHEEFADLFHKWKHGEEDESDAKADMEDDFYSDPIYFDEAYFGRMSPFSKEILFREYQKGMTVKDLSLKYGILKERVKAIVYQKYLYWHEVYPKMGETHMRLAIEREAIYAAEYPFIEYG